MKLIKTNAIVLSRTNYGEADRILQLLTPEGKISAIAKGVRRESSKLAGGIELFSICEVVITEGKGDLGIITSARLVKFFGHILEDYDRLQFSYLVIKLVNKACEAIDTSEWFDILKEVIMALDVKTIRIELIQTWFYLRYASMLGYEMGLFLDTNGEKIQIDKKYRYNQNDRGLELVENGDLSSDHIKLMRLIANKSIRVLVQIGGISDIISSCLFVAREHASISN